MGALVTAAEVIRDETTPGANTATRVGQSMVNQAQAIEDGGQPKILAVKINFDDNNNPTMDVVFNSISDSATITRENVGSYRLNYGANLNTSKIMPPLRNSFRDDNGNVLFALFETPDPAYLEISTIIEDGSVTDALVSNYAIQIEVYP